MTTLILGTLLDYLERTPVWIGLIILIIGLGWVILSRRFAGNSYEDYRDVPDNSAALIIHRILGFLCVIGGGVLIILSCLDII